WPASSRRVKIMTRHAVAIVLASAVSTIGFGQCSANGLTLSYHGERLGDPFSLTLSGTPGVSGLLGVDLVPGSSPPVGNVCLGLSSSMQLIFFSLDSAGQFAATDLLPANPTLVGLSVFLQAAAFDATQPSGTAVSN